MLPPRPLDGQHRSSRYPSAAALEIDHSLAFEMMQEQRTEDEVEAGIFERHGEGIAGELGVSGWSKVVRHVVEGSHSRLGIGAKHHLAHLARSRPDVE